jgi:hypothetical protein
MNTRYNCVVLKSGQHFRFDKDHLSHFTSIVRLVLGSTFLDK